MTYICSICSLDTANVSGESGKSGAQYLSATNRLFVQWKYNGLQNHGRGFDSLRVCFNHIVKRVFWYVEIPIFQAKGTHQYEKITDHNIGVKSLSVVGANPTGSKLDGSVIEYDIEILYVQ